MTQLTLDSYAGAALKEAGLDQVEGDAEFLWFMRDAAKAISAVKGRVTSDDLREIATNLGKVPRSSHSWGAIFRGNEWKMTGRCKSAVPGNHSREIKIWRWEG